ncbi:MAG: MBL fold metallo-hydrolase [Myxococcota bacterium]
MITSVQAGPYSVRGVSVGGVYTSLQVPELGVLLDCGMALRGVAATDDIFLSHGHADHIGALPALLGIRGLMQRPPPRLFVPAAITDAVTDALAAMSVMQRYDLAVDMVGLAPGDEVHLRDRLWARAFRTYHPVPSLGFQFFRRVEKLKPAFQSLPGPEIGRRRAAGDDLFYTEDRLELAYATDTLIRVLEAEPALTRSRVLILECSFLDERKSLAAARAGCHIHLDELVEVAPSLENDHIVLMHFSQIYKPREVHSILRDRLTALGDRLLIFAPNAGVWPG